MTWYEAVITGNNISVVTRGMEDLLQVIRLLDGHAKEGNLGSDVVEVSLYDTIQTKGVIVITVLMAIKNRVDVSHNGVNRIDVESAEAIALISPSADYEIYLSEI